MVSFFLLTNGEEVFDFGEDDQNPIQHQVEHDYRRRRRSKKREKKIRKKTFELVQKKKEKTIIF